MNQSSEENIRVGGTKISQIKPQNKESQKGKRSIPSKGIHKVVNPTYIRMPLQAKQRQQMKLLSTIVKS